MNRGSSPSSKLSSRPADTFNEAPIHESGKSPSSAELLARRIPSMRPRFMNRGSKPSPALQAKVDALLQ